MTPGDASVRRHSVISAVIVNYEGGDLLAECVGSLLGQDGLAEVIVVDNGSTDGSAEHAASVFSQVVLVRPDRNLGFAGGANAGARCAKGELLLFLNPDVVLADGCLNGLAKLFDDPDVGVAGPSLRLARSRALEYGSTLDLFGQPVGLAEPGEPLFVSGCALATWKSLFEELGGFDDRFFMFMEDVDYCWRALIAGWRIEVAEDALALHVGGAATPGGYERGGRIESSAFRIGLRERNTLTAMLKCYGSLGLALAVPAYVIQLLLTALAFALAGKQRIARDVIGGLVWNGRELGKTLALRRRVQARRSVPDLDVLKRLYPGSRKVELLFKKGFPSIVDDPASYVR
jgi:GT2 family glycosyltransferase